MSRSAARRGTVAVAALALALLLPGLGALPLLDPDEGRHAEIARELAEAPSWSERVVPQLEGRAYHDKPILFYWMAAAALAVLGVHPAAARLPSAAAGVVTALVTTAAGTRCFGRRAGMLAGLVLVTAPQFQVLARAATLDMLLTLWLTLGVLAAWRWAAGGAAAWLALAAVAAGLGTLTKGLVAPVLIAATTLAWLASERRLARLRPAPLALAVVAFLVPVLPWLLAAAQRDPDYLRELLLTHHVQRFLGGGPGRLHPASVFFYVPVLLLGFFPWSLLLPATAAATLHRDARAAAERFCAGWALVVLAFFTASRGKLAPYVLPALPPLALLTGRALDRLFADGGSPAAAPRPGEPAARGRRLAVAGLLAAGGVVAAAPAVAVPLAATRYGGMLLPLAWWTTALVPAGVAVAVLAWRGRLRTAVGMAAAVLAVAGAAIPWLASGTVGELTGTPQLAAIARREPADTVVVVYGFAMPSLSFALGRPVTYVDRPRALARLLAAAPHALVVTSPRHAAEVRGAAPLVLRWSGPRRMLFAPDPGVGSAPRDRYDRAP